MNRIFLTDTVTGARREVPPETVLKVVEDHGMKELPTCLKDPKDSLIDVMTAYEFLLEFQGGQIRDIRARDQVPGSRVGFSRVWYVCDPATETFWSTTVSQE